MQQLFAIHAPSYFLCGHLTFVIPGMTKRWNSWFKRDVSTMSEPTCYFVTDVETDGPIASQHSMLSFETVAVHQNGEILDEFESVLKPRPGFSEHKQTMQWWESQPQAYVAATSNAKEPRSEMQRFADWVKTHSGKRKFAARPLIFDGAWIDEYLRVYLSSSIMAHPYQSPDLFTGAGLDIPTYMLGIFGRTESMKPPYNIPDEWLGNHAHTDKAIDDARGYASLLSKLLILANSQPPHPADFLEQKS